MFIEKWNEVKMLIANMIFSRLSDFLKILHYRIFSSFIEKEYINAWAPDSNINVRYISHNVRFKIFKNVVIYIV